MTRRNQLFGNLSFGRIAPERVSYGGPLLVSLIPWLGIIGVVVGIVWMIRIYRADPEPAEPTWRYRDL